VRQLGFDPAARLARVPPDQDVRRGVPKAADESGPETPDGWMIQRILARMSADAVGTEQPGAVTCHC
jgi:hypothetical protein